MQADADKRVAEGAVARRPSRHLLTPLGSLFCRLGQHDTTIARLSATTKRAVQTTMEQQQNQPMPEELRRILGLQDNAWDDLLLALAHQGKKEYAEAKKHLQRAVEWIEKEKAELNWNERLELELLRREVEGKGKAALPN